MLQNVKYPDKCLRVRGGSKVNNAELDITDCDKSKADQQLNVEDWAVRVHLPLLIHWALLNVCFIALRIYTWTNYFQIQRQMSIGTWWRSSQW